MGDKAINALTPAWLLSGTAYAANTIRLSLPIKEALMKPARAGGEGSCRRPWQPLQGLTGEQIIDRPILKLFHGGTPIFPWGASIF